MNIDLLHFHDGQPFGLRLMGEGAAAVQCPTCARWSAIRAADVMQDAGGPTLNAEQGPFLVCGHADCHQEFTITRGVTTLPFGARP